MSVQLLRSDLGFAFSFRCDGGCSRPAIIALTLPPGWEVMPSTEGLVHRCGNCRFDLIVEPLIRDLGWEAAA